MTIVYLAGPDVFRPDAGDLALRQKALCQHYGYVPRHPFDQSATTSAAIFRTNVAMINEADVILANLDPFRGPEVDSGTAFEVGFATALRKPVIGYLTLPETLRERVARLHGEIRYDAAQQDWRDRDDHLIEDFGHPINLMLAEACAAVVAGGLEAALRWLNENRPVRSAGMR